MGTGKMNETAVSARFRDMGRGHWHTLLFPLASRRGASQLSWSGDRSHIGCLLVLLIQVLCLVWTDGRSRKTNSRLGIKQAFLPPDQNQAGPGFWKREDMVTRNWEKA